MDKSPTALNENEQRLRQIASCTNDSVIWLDIPCETRKIDMKTNCEDRSKPITQSFKLSNKFIVHRNFN